MRLLDLTLDSPEANLALDEALLETADEADGPREVLRIWESPQPLVVLGRASRVAAEVDQAACQTRGTPVLRRCSGGAGVVVGPGCLMYAMVLSYQLRPELQPISAAHCFALRRLGNGLRCAVPEIECRGTSDLTLGGKKFSGNSLRVKRSCVLYHGTLLYDFPLGLVEELPVHHHPRRRQGVFLGRTYNGQAGRVGRGTRGITLAESAIRRNVQEWPAAHASTEGVMSHDQTE